MGVIGICALSVFASGFGELAIVLYYHEYITYGLSTLMYRYIGFSVLLLTP